MNVDQITSALNGRSASGSGSLFLPGQDDFATKLTLGQVIKAKVLRHYEGSRYAVDFNGQEKVVDSSNPLRPGELIEGRVKSLGQQVEIQRLNQFEKATTQSSAMPVENTGVSDQRFMALFGQNKSLNQVRNFFIQKQAALNVEELTLIRGLLSANQPTNAVMMAALAIKKAGIALTKESVSSVVEALTNKSLKFSHLPLSDAASLISAGHMTAVDSGSLVKDLANLIRQYDEHGQNFYAPSGDQQSDFSEQNNREEKDHLAKWLLNIQDESSINHRLLSLPLWLGEKFVELKMAFFDQNASKNTHNQEASPFKRVVFTIDFQSLGPVVVSTVMHGQRMSLTLTTNDTEATEYIANYMGTLKRSIESAGWSVDQLEYATVVENEFEPAVNAVVQHYIAKDSLSRLL